MKRLFSIVSMFLAVTIASVANVIVTEQMSATKGVQVKDSVQADTYYIISGIDQSNAEYYLYDNGRFSGAFGSFPRKILHRELPDIFVYYSLRYYSPVLHGALIKYECEYGYVEAYCNWINKQSGTQREIFEIVSDGKYFLPSSYDRLT